MPSDMLTFSTATHEASFLPSYFKAAAGSVQKIRWADGIKNGAVIRQGTKLATIVWDDGSEIVMTPPPGCSGTIQATNRRITYETLHRSPAQLALRLYA